MKTLTIGEAQAAKAEVERQIRDLLNGFMLDTGLVVKEVSIENIGWNVIGQGFEARCSRVELKVSL